MLQAYIDDSGSDLKGPAYVLTGYASDIQSWFDFTDEWQAMLAQHPGIEYFKMREAESLKGQFEGWSREQATAKIHALIPIINRYAGHRIECVFWQEHYDSAMNWYLPEIKKQLSPMDFNRVKKAFSNPYFLAFSLVMTDFAKRLAHDNSDDIVDFIFDSQGAIGKRAVEWWRESHEILPNMHYEKHLPNEPVHRDEKIFLPLQAADLLAWQTRRRLEDYNIYGKEAPRLEYQMLQSVHLYPNRWNEKRLRALLESTLTPIAGEENL